MFAILRCEIWRLREVEELVSSEIKLSWEIYCTCHDIVLLIHCILTELCMNIVALYFTIGTFIALLSNKRHKQLSFMYENPTLVHMQRCCRLSGCNSDGSTVEGSCCICYHGHSFVELYSSIWFVVNVLVMFVSMAGVMRWNVHSHWINIHGWMDYSMLLQSIL